MFRRKNINPNTLIGNLTGISEKLDIMVRLRVRFFMSKYTQFRGSVGKSDLSI